MTKVFPALQVTQVFQDPLVPQVARKVKKESQESLANGENQAKMATRVLQAFLESKESLAAPVLQAGMERGEIKVIVDTQAHQE